MKTFERIITKYAPLSHDEDVYYIGGGLSRGKFASRRHEATKEDPGKITLGKAVQMFVKASDLSGEEVKSIIKYAVPNMEWHHAGKLPKQYGGGMKKTYFLNSQEVTYIAENWNNLLQQFAISLQEKRQAAEIKKNKDQAKQEYLNKHAKNVFRALQRPEFFHEMAREMNGKYGWFSCYGKDYNLTVYYSGWAFASEGEYKIFLKLFT